MRSAATECTNRVMTAPTTPPTSPNPSNPNTTKLRLLTSGSPGFSGPGQNRVSKRRAATPQAAPATVGIVSSAVAPGRDSTATQPRTPAAAITALPSGRRCVSRVPAIAAIVAITTSTTTARKSLSRAPRVAIAHSLTGPGVRSTTAEPIAVRASARAPNGMPTSWATPSETAAAATPAIIRSLDGAAAIELLYSRSPERP